MPDGGTFKGRTGGTGGGHQAVCDPIHDFAVGTQVHQHGARGGTGQFAGQSGGDNVSPDKPGNQRQGTNDCFRIKAQADGSRFKGLFIHKGRLVREHTDGRWIPAGENMDHGGVAHHGHGGNAQRIDSGGPANRAGGPLHGLDRHFLEARQKLVVLLDGADTAHDIIAVQSLGIFC